MTRLWVLGFAFACGTHNAQPPTAQPSAPADAVVSFDAPLALDQDLPRLAARAVKLYEDVGGALAASGDDCRAAATKLAELTAIYAAVVAANAKLLNDGRAIQLKVALRPYEVQFDAAAKAIMASTTLSACSQDPAFAKAFDELVGGPP